MPLNGAHQFPSGKGHRQLYEVKVNLQRNLPQGTTAVTVGAVGYFEACNQSIINYLNCGIWEYQVILHQLAHSVFWLAVKHGPVGFHNVC